MYGTAVRILFYVFQPSHNTDPDPKNCWLELFQAIRCSQVKIVKDPKIQDPPSPLYRCTLLSLLLLTASSMRTGTALQGVLQVPAGITFPCNVNLTDFTLLVLRQHVLLPKKKKRNS